MFQFYLSTCPLVCGCRRNVVLYGLYKKDILEELFPESSAIVNYEFLTRTVIEHSKGNKVFRDIGNRDTLHLYLLGHLQTFVRDYQGMLVLSRRADEWAGDIYAH